MTFKNCSVYYECLDSSPDYKALIPRFFISLNRRTYIVRLSPYLWDIYAQTKREAGFTDREFITWMEEGAIEKKLQYADKGLSDYLQETVENCLRFASFDLKIEHDQISIPNEI